MKHLSPFLLPAHYAKTLMVVGMMLIVTKLSGNLQWSWAVVLSPFYAVHLFYALLTVCVLAWLRIDDWLQRRWAARYYERLKRDQADAAYDATGLPGFLQESHDRRPNVNAPPTYARPPMPPGPRIQVDLGDGRVLDHKQVGE